MSSENGTEGRLLMPAEVGRIYKVDARTITRWARQGRFLPGTVVTTLGGHRRYRESLVLAQLRARESTS